MFLKENIKQEKVIIHVHVHREKRREAEQLLSPAAPR